MKILTVRRIYDLEDGTFGVIDCDGIPFALTLERKWLNNRKGESCIPKGEYLCKRVLSPKFGGTFEVMEVPGRDAILFHKGNIDDDSHGCIIIGDEFGMMNEKTAVLSSGKAFVKFLGKLVGEDEFRLVVI